MSTGTVVYEQTATGWGAFVPALPGVVEAGAARAEAEQLTGEAIALHLQGLTEDGLPMPDPGSVDVGQVELLEIRRRCWPTRRTTGSGARSFRRLRLKRWPPT